MTQHNRDDIVDNLDMLSDSQLQLLGSMAAAMAEGAVRVTVNPGSDLVTPPFADAFTNFLLLHHAIYEGPLNKESFEFVFAVANEAAGRSAVRNALRGSNTHDIKVDGTKWSLKTEAGRSATAKQVRIEKWMEARWIRECTNPADCATAMQRVVEHMADYERIMVLQAITSPYGATTDYRLIELPRPAIVSLASLHHSNFKKEGNKKSYGADVVDSGGRKIFRILLDSSVEKIRIWFNTESCVSHGLWEVIHDPVSGSGRLNI